MTNLKKDVIDKRLVNSVKYLYLSLRLVWSLFTCKRVCKQMWKQAQGTKKVVEGSNVCDWPCFLFANAKTVLTVDFEMERALRIKTNNIIAVFFFFWFLFSYAIQGKSITWRGNSILNCTWKPISHSSLRDSCNIGFHAQFNVEFPRQVMNFPIE